MDETVPPIDDAEEGSAFLKRRAGDAKPADLLWFLDNAAKEPPEPADSL